MSSMPLPVSSVLGLTPPKVVYVRKNTYSDRFHPPRQLHRHEYCEIRLVTSGRCDFTQNDRQHILSEGDFLICNAGTFHAENFDPSSSADFLTVAFSNLNIPSLPSGCLIPPDSPPVHHAGGRFPVLCALFDAMHHSFRSQDPMDTELTNHALCAFLLEILQISGIRYPHSDHTVQTSRKAAVRSIKEYIDRHYTEDLTLRRIGQALNFSPSQVSHAFKKEMGCSPLQYMTLLRIGEAQTLLMNTDLPITEIANRIGYNTPNNFYIMFKKSTGISPTLYRQNWEGVQWEK